MDPDGNHASSILSSASEIVPHSAAHERHQDDDLSDSDLSQFQAEIEQNLSSASPGSSPANGAILQASDDAMDVDTEDMKQANMANFRKRTVVREYYDPELYGLRRSVSRICPSQRRWVGDTFVNRQD